MSHISTRFPIDIHFAGVHGGPEYSTTIVELASGREQRNGLWELPRGSWDIEYVRSDAQLETIKQYFHACRGRLHTFAFRMPEDYQCIQSAGALSTAAIGAGIPAYQLYKLYVVGSVTGYRKVTLPIAGAISVYRNSSLVTIGAGAGNIGIDYATGIVTFVADASSAASSITVGATTQVILAANPGTLIAGQRLYLSGFTGADAGLINGLAHTINSVTGAGPYTFTLATNTAGKTITLGAGIGAKYPQTSESLQWAGEFNIVARFSSDKFDAQHQDRGGGSLYWAIAGLGITEVKA